MDPFPGLKRPHSDHPAMKELERLFQEKHSKANRLLANIKDQVERIRSVYDHFEREEPDLVYRYYHQSYKVFIMAALIENADKLFKELAPEGVVVSDTYSEIAAGGIGKKFHDETNANWQTETLPMMCLPFGTPNTFSLKC